MSSPVTLQAASQETDLTRSSASLPSTEPASHTETLARRHAEGLGFLACGSEMIQIYTGDGKGKTTAAVGLAVRAAGHGRRVAFVQFMKEDAVTAGEFRVLASLPGVRVLRYGSSMLTPMPSNAVRDAVRDGLAEVRRLLEAGEADVVVLDEANVACSMGLIGADEVLEALAGAPAETEVVITGRGAPQALLDRADLVTEMVARRHPHERGIPARRGIDY